MTMTINPLALCLCLLSIITTTIVPACRADDIKLTSSLRGTTTEQQQQQQQNHRILERPDHPCLLVRVETEFGNDITVGGEVVQDAFIDDGSLGPSHKVLCELVDEDVDKAGGQYFVPIMGIDESQLDNIKSGETTLAAEGAVFLDGALQIPADAQIEYGTIDDNDGRRLRQKRRRSLSTTGTKRVLVIRVNAADRSTSASISELSNNIFGTYGDTVTMKSQYNQCSYGKLQIEPFVGRTETGVYVNGVIDVNIGNTMSGSDRTDIESAVVVAAKNKLGDLRAYYDHVMLCLPSGSSSNRWIAYAYVNSWLSVYNDRWCQKLSTQVHELAHNFGLAHSGSGGISYGDKSGMMGYSYNEDDSPKQCFNPAKSYELGWYSDKVVEWDPLSQGTWVGTIVGVSDYGNKQIANSKVVVRIDRGGNDLYLGYNREKDMNSGVKANGDQVTIVEEDQGYSKSNFIAGLNPGNRKTFSNFRNSGKTLFVDYISTDNSRNEAKVAIYFDDCVYPGCCEGSLCGTASPPPTSAPTARPTATPVSAPTRAPVPAPTRAPVPAPTRAPVPAPTSIVDKDIKDSPIVDPILYEMVPNPKIQRAEYVEIYNPGTTKINLSDYQICFGKGDTTTTCDQLTNNFYLGSGEYYVLCRDQVYMEENNMLPAGRICHQDGDNNFIIRHRNQKVFLQRDNRPVDTVDITNANRNREKAYVRKGGCNTANTENSNDCWQWREPAMATIYDDDDQTLSEAGVEYDIQSLPPFDFGSNETYTIGDTAGDEIFWDDVDP